MAYSLGHRRYLGQTSGDIQSILDSIRAINPDWADQIQQWGTSFCINQLGGQFSALLQSPIVWLGLGAFFLLRRR